jgi:co-chaperonin GroES (HSP10)
MQKIRLRGNKVAIEKIKKVQKGSFGGIIVPDSEEYCGYIRYVGEEASKDLKVGQKVYFTTNHQNFRILGAELSIMEDSQVLALVDETKES